MKKILFLLIVGALFAVPQVSSADDSTNNITKGANAIIHLNFEEDKLVYKTVSEIFLNQNFNTSNKALNQSEAKIYLYLLELLKNKDLNLIAETSSSTKYFYYKFSSASQEFENLISEIQKYENLENKVYFGNKVYSPQKRESFALTYYNGEILISSSVGQLTAVLKELTENNVEQNINAPDKDYIVQLNYSQSQSEKVIRDLNNGLDQFTTNNFDLNSFGNSYVSINQPSKNSFTINSSNNLNATNIDLKEFAGKLEIVNMAYSNDNVFFIELFNFNGLISSIFGIQEFGDLDIFKANGAIQIDFNNGPIPNFAIYSKNTETKTDLSEMFVQENYKEIASTTGYKTFKTESASNSQDPIEKEISNAPIYLGTKENYSIITNNSQLIENFGASKNKVNLNYISNSTSNAAVTFKLDFQNFYSLITKIDGIKSNFNSGLTASEQQSLRDANTFEYQLSLNGSEVMQEILIDLKNSAKYIKDFSSIFNEISYNLDFLNQDLNFTSAGFNDIDSNSWYASSINNLAQNNVIKKYNSDTNPNFRPNAQITRAEFAMLILGKNRQILTQAGHIPSTGRALGSSVFKDVAANSWYDEVIGRAYNLGILKGNQSDQTVRPNAPITRAEAAQVLLNSSALIQNTPASAVPFIDVETSWYTEALEKSFSLGIIKGKSSNKFAPNDNITRAEAAVIIDRLRLQEFNLF